MEKTTNQVSSAIQCRNLKVYRNIYNASDTFRAGYVTQICLPDITMDVKKGYVTGLIGRSGGGKSTLILALAGHLEWDAGTVEYDGLTWKKDSKAIRRTVAFVFDQMVLPERRTGFQIAKLVAEVEPWFDWDFFHRTMERLEVPEKRAICHYSAGMKKKFYLVLAMSRRPMTLVLDEPTTGVDPVARREILDLLQEFMEDGEHSILFSTHITGDLDRIADEIVILSGGKVLLQEEKETLKKQLAEPDGTLPEIEQMMERIAKEGLQ